MKKTTSRLSSLYFDWLVKAVKTDQKDIPLMKHLHQTIFYSILPNDDNRAIDGELLRYVFEDEEDISTVDTLVNRMNCSVLEMLIALSRRAISDIIGEDEGSVSELFWEMIDNVGYRSLKPDMWTRITKKLIERKYLANGFGGLFPLKNEQQDQRQVEIWYQLAAYLSEKGEIR